MTRFPGNPNRWSADPGERVRFMASSEDAAGYRGDIATGNARRKMK